MSSTVVKEKQPRSEASRSRKFIRRRSSSENDLDVFMAKRYLKDNRDANKADEDGSKSDNGLEGQGQGKLMVPKRMDRNSSDSDLVRLEKLRCFSTCEEEGSVTPCVDDETELELEAVARHESISMTTTDAVEVMTSKQQLLGSRRSSGGNSGGKVENVSAFERGHSLKKKSRDHTRKSTLSDDSGCETLNKSMTHSRGSGASQTGGSIKRKLFSQTIVCSGELEEDVFEAKLEEQARRASLASLGIDATGIDETDEDFEVARRQGTLADGDGDDDVVQNGTVVSIYLEDNKGRSEPRIMGRKNNCKLGKVESCGGGLGISLDEDYLSSSPSMSLTPVFPPNTPVEEKKVTPLGMSIDSEDDPSSHPQRLSFDHKDSVEIVVENDTDDDDDNVDESVETEKKYNKDRRRSSVIEDMSLMCSECRRQRKKCKDCKLLLESQEFMRKHEQRRKSLSSGGLNEVGLGNGKGVEVKLNSINGIMNLNTDLNGLTCRNGGSSKSVDGKGKELEVKLVRLDLCNTDNMSAASGECNVSDNKVPTINTDSSVFLYKSSDKSCLDVNEGEYKLRHSSLSDSELNKTTEACETDDDGRENVKMFPVESTKFTGKASNQTRESWVLAVFYFL